MGDDMQVDGTCSHKVTAEHPLASGQVLDTSTLMFGVSKITWTSANIFADAKVDASLDVTTDLKIEVGKEVFGHHCTHLGQKTVGAHVRASGEVGIGVNATCSNARVETATSGTGLDLVFNFAVDTVGVVLPAWKTEQVDASNCNLDVLGIKIGSYCGFVVDHVRDGVEAAVMQVSTVTAPAVAAKLEQVLQAKIGSEVRIPLVHLPLATQTQVVI